MKRELFALCTVCGTYVFSPTLHAQDFSVHAYGDERLVAAPDETSWTRGGFGKTRYGDGKTQFHFGGAAVLGTAQVTPSLLALGQLQYQTSGHSGLSLLEGYLRYRPVSTSPWRWSLKAGAFFPPVSLENDAIGWTSPWTLSSSAINTWVGEELRVVGGEFQLEHRGAMASWDLRASLFRRDDPSGSILAYRGWSVGDLVAGIGSRLREPDAEVTEKHGRPPRYYDPFRSIGPSHWGNYVSLTWHAPGDTRVNLLHYDNHADPSAWAPYAGGKRQYAWRDRFWSIGARTETGPVTWIAQAMDGDTTWTRIPNLPQKTRYRAAFVLLGWNRGTWRPTLRVEHFSTQLPDDTSGDTPGEHQGEHGNAITAALNWRPRDWLRFTVEALRIRSTSTLRGEYGLPERVGDTQVQLSTRLLY
ncbi:hypothetical protein [Dyella subtropica]|uniref:hypothetical protein n=1 Tax=Dyella subtropica TaxID=2992127 RepID=UPI00225039BD|nr:hypothetical protein [Dyella subtropica]